MFIRHKTKLNFKHEMQFENIDYIEWPVELIYLYLQTPIMLLLNFNQIMV